MHGAGRGNIFKNWINYDRIFHFQNVWNVAAIKEWEVFLEPCQTSAMEIFWENS